MKKFIGSKAFYLSVVAVAVPIMIQSGITNFVNLIDNIMVGQVGTEQMSAVAIVNQLIFVYNITIFGCISGPGIFSAQFYGKGDTQGVRHTFRYKFITSVTVTIIALCVLCIFKGNLIDLYLNDSNNPESIAITKEYAIKYFNIAVWGLPGFALSQIYSTTLRETNQTILPMIGGIIAVVTNTSLNYVLIFGKFGCPVFGIEGAASATIIARYLEFLFVAIVTHCKADQNTFIKGAYKSLHIPKNLVIDITKKSLPLLCNECIWSVSMAVILQSYSTRGLDAVASVNITSTVTNVFNVVFYALGSAIAIMVGQQLGAGNMEKAKDTDRKLLALAIVSHIFIGLLMFSISRSIPQIYNTSDEVKALATELLVVAACYIPMKAFSHCCYFTMRSGGRTGLTFLFDSGTTWIIMIPTAYIITRFTNLDLIYCYMIVEGSEIVKAIGGFFLVKSGIWARNLVKNES